MQTAALDFLLDLHTDDDDLYRLQLIRNWWSEIVWQFTQELEEEYRRILAHARREYLNTDDLHAGILSGQIELRNLSLKPAAFADLGLPVELRGAFIGKLRLSIPWTSLTSAPVEVDIVSATVSRLRCSPFQPHSHFGRKYTRAGTA